MSGAAASVLPIFRYRLTCEYIGTRFHGWQKQSKALELATVSGMLEEAASQTGMGELVGSVVGAGRTDAGVHGLGQSAHFDFRPRRGVPVSNDDMRDVMNHHMPGSHRNALRVLRCEHVPNEFHARFDCTSRVYVYHIATAPTSASRLFDSQLSWWLPSRLDVDRIHQATQIFSGEHDLHPFRAAGCQASTTVRTLDLSVSDTVPDVMDGVRRHGILDEVRCTGAQHIFVRAEQSSFLYKQMRLMVGYLVEIGQGRKSLDDLRRILNTGRSPMALKTAPPHGLYFVAAKYDPNVRKVHEEKDQENDAGSE
jgi:tRNA pseudouridine38-40 synthase